MRNAWLAAALVVALAIGAACSSPSDPPALDTTCTLDCTAHDAGHVANPSDGSPPVDADAGCLPLTDADTFMGVHATVTGTIGPSAPPGFVAFPSATLTQPATVHYPFGGFDYVGTYAPGGDGGVPGFSLQAPPGDSVVYVSDVGGLNGILDTMMGAHVEQGGVFKLPAVSRAELDAIYASVNPPITRDVGKSQIIFSMQTSPINGAVPVAGGTFSIVGPSDGTLYDVPGGGFARGTATGPAGVAIVANYDAFNCTGSKYNFSYTVNGKTFANQSFVGMQGKVVRVPLELASN